MNFLYNECLCCPMDQLPLRPQDNSLLCEKGHSFDIATRGYVNLLGANEKRSRDPGDSKEMVLARGEFLNSGHYQPVADRLAELVQPLIGARSIIADAGCGEGYYLEQLHKRLTSTGSFTPTMIGYDISKWAVQAATRRLAVTWLVASNRNVPLAPDSVDCLLSLFGFPIFESFLAVLQDGGTLLMVDAGPQHLVELREVLYPTVTYSESKVIPNAQAAGFSVGKTSSLQFQTAPLSQLEINQLLSMTPHLFRTTSAGRKRSALLDNFPVTVDVIFSLFQKDRTTGSKDSIL